MTEKLGKLFGSVPRIKIMRLFLLNPEQGFTVAGVSERSKVSKAIVRREVSLLLGAGFISNKKVTEESINKRTGKRKTKSLPGFIINQNYQYLKPIEKLLIEADFMKKTDLLKRFRPVGKIKLFIISGVFLQEANSRVDFMIVGDNIKKNTLENIIRKLEAEIGKELLYAVFETKDFLYRVSMYDKLIREVLDGPNEKVFESAEFSTHLLQKS